VRPASRPDPVGVLGLIVIIRTLIRSYGCVHARDGLAGSGIVTATDRALRPVRVMGNHRPSRLVDRADDN